MTIIKDGLSGNTAAVDGSNRLDVHAVTVTETQEAIQNGDAYNINTGLITITGATESALFYLKNNEERDFIVDAIAVGVTDGDTSDSGIVTVVKNPTSVSFSADVDMNSNRNFGSSNTLASSLVYKGADAATITGGSDLGIFLQNDNGRLFATVNVGIPKGRSIAIKYDPNLASGSLSVYAALIGHLKREE
jgi:hypothetical protein